MSAIEQQNLATTFVRLRSDATVERLPVDETFWERLMGGTLGDFHNEYLVIMTQFDADWPTWEKHPNGDEIVCLLDGEVEFLLELPDGRSSLTLHEAGAYVVVPAGTWHTAKIRRPSRMLFITAGEGTENGPDPAGGS